MFRSLTRHLVPAALAALATLSAAPEAHAGPVVTVVHTSNGFVRPARPAAPPVRVAIRPRRPGPRHVWVTGAWHWNGAAWAWHTGYWRPPTVVVHTTPVRPEPVVHHRPVRRVVHRPAPTVIHTTSTTRGRGRPNTTVVRTTTTRTVRR